MRLLAQLTRQVAVVQYPSLTRSTVRHIELVPLTDRRLLLVLITDTGRVEQRLVDLPGRVGEDSITQLRAVLNACLDGRRLTEVASVVAELPERVRRLISQIFDAAVDMWRHVGEVYLSGSADIADDTETDDDHLDEHDVKRASFHKEPSYNRVLPEHIGDLDQRGRPGVQHDQVRRAQHQSDRRGRVRPLQAALHRRTRRSLSVRRDMVRRTDHPDHDAD